MKPIKTLVGSVCLALAACGGGSGDGPSGALVTQTSGTVTSVNGQSANVSGVEIAAPAQGKNATSSATGAFSLGALPAQPIELTVRSPGGRPDSITIDLSGGGSARLRMSIDDDGVARMSVERCSGSDGEAETRVAMTAVQAGLKGKIEIEAKVRGDQKFEVEAEHLVADQAVEILISKGGSTENLGTFTANTLGEVELEIETENGGVLPLGAAQVSDLEGATVEVKDVGTGDTLLTGTVPVLGALPTSCGDDDDGDDDDRSEGESRLINASGVTGEAKVELESRPDRNEEEFEIKVERSNVTDTMQCWLEDPSNAGTLVNIGTLRLEEDGDRELEFETDDGDTLPFGVSGVSSLVGLAIEIRQAGDGAVVFSGTTPPVR